MKLLMLFETGLLNPYIVCLLLNCFLVTLLSARGSRIPPKLCLELRIYYFTLWFCIYYFTLILEIFYLIIIIISAGKANFSVPIHKFYFTSWVKNSDRPQVQFRIQVINVWRISFFSVKLLAKRLKHQHVFN